MIKSLWSPASVRAEIKTVHFPEAMLLDEAEADDDMAVTWNFEIDELGATWAKYHTDTGVLIEVSIALLVVVLEFLYRSRSQCGFAAVDGR